MHLPAPKKVGMLFRPLSRRNMRSSVQVQRIGYERVSSLKNAVVASVQVADLAKKHALHTVPLLFVGSRGECANYDPKLRSTKERERERER